jgi:hypothetical protein
MKTKAFTTILAREELAKIAKRKMKRNKSDKDVTEKAVKCNNWEKEFMERENKKVTELVDLIENCKKPSTIHTKIHRTKNDYYDSAFIEGWNFALDKVIKHLLKICILGGKKKNMGRTLFKDWGVPGR